MMLTLLESHSLRCPHCSVLVVLLLLVVGSRSVLSSQKSFSGFVKFKLDDFTVGGINWDLNCGSGFLVSDDFLDVDAPSSSIDGDDLSLLVLNSVFDTAFKNFDGVTHSNRKGSAIILGGKFFA